MGYTVDIIIIKRIMKVEQIMNFRPAVHFKGRDMRVPYNNLKKKKMYIIKVFIKNKTSKKGGNALFTQFTIFKPHFTATVLQ